MPLAIELAAARIKLLSPDAILSRLEHQLNVLAAGSRDLPERQQTLRGAIAWSYDILDEPCRLLLDRLSVFEGDIEIDAAEAVCGPASELGQEVVDGLLSLANQSLIRTIEDPAESRFEMLDTIREFATEMLEGRGQRAELERRHGAWFAAFAERGAAQLSGDDQRAWLERFEHAHDNIRVALDRATAREDAAVAINLAFHTWRFWQKRGHLYEARRRLDAIAAAEWSRRDPTLRARLLEALGGVAWWQGDITAMARAYDEAVGIWRAHGQPVRARERACTTTRSSTPCPTPSTASRARWIRRARGRHCSRRRLPCIRRSATNGARRTRCGDSATSGTSRVMSIPGRRRSPSPSRSSGASAIERWRPGRCTCSAARSCGLAAWTRRSRTCARPSGSSTQPATRPA